jgi:hypothetical protein
METNAIVTLISPLRLDSQGFDAAGHFRLTVNGGTSARFVLLASTNLAGTNWISLLTNPVTAQPFPFLDTNASQYRQRLYRAINSP